jgi:hypothetical protein
LGCSSVENGPVQFHFKTPQRPGPPNGANYEASLAAAAREDRSASGAVLAAFSQDADPDVRAQAARALPRLDATGAAATLSTAARAEESPEVRKACLGALAELKFPELPALAKHLAIQDEIPDVQAEALRVLVQTAPKEAETGRFLTDCLLSGRPDGALQALTESAFRTYESAPTPSLQEGLSTFLLQHATSDADLIEIFVDQAVSQGMVQFIPIFRAIETSLPADSTERDALGRGARQLEDAPRYVELAARIRESENNIQGLWDEIRRPETSVARDQELRRQIMTQMNQLSELKGALRDK